MSTVKWIKRCVIVIGFAVSGILAKTSLQNDGIVNYITQAIENKKPPGVPPGFLDTRDLILLNGFRYELHTATTEDGYILKLHRILTDVQSGPPVIFQHGFLAASDTLLLRDRKSCLAFMLADAGFDVWLPDQRGDWYSREHIKYEPSNPKFWDFSFHEAGYFDVPAIIDKIINTTGHSQVQYIGHSMGTTVFFVMASLRPEYNKKINIAVLLAPISIVPPLKDLESGPLRLLVAQADLLYNTLKKSGIYEFLPRNGQNIQSVRRLCGPSITQDICLDIIGIIYGEDRENLDRLMIGYQLSYLPAGSSIKTALHLSQIYRNGFRLFDYGLNENLRVYNSETPPFYPLKNITAPVALFWGASDRLTSRRSIESLAKTLPNLVTNQEIDEPKFTHVDFIYGMNAVALYNDIIFILESKLR